MTYKKHLADIFGRKEYIKMVRRDAAESNQRYTEAEQTHQAIVQIQQAMGVDLLSLRADKCEEVFNSSKFEGIVESKSDWVIERDTYWCKFFYNDEEESYRFLLQFKPYTVDIEFIDIEN